MIFMGKIISMVVKKWRPDNRYWLAIGSAVELVGRAAFSRERMLLSRGGGHFSKGEDGAVIVGTACSTSIQNKQPRLEGMPWRNLVLQVVWKALASPQAPVSQILTWSWAVNLEQLH